MGNRTIDVELEELPRIAEGLAHIGYDCGAMVMPVGAAGTGILAHLAMSAHGRSAAARAAGTSAKLATYSGTYATMAGKVLGAYGGYWTADEMAKAGIMLRDGVEQQYLAHGHSMAKSFSPLNVLKLLTLTPLTPLNLITIKKRQRLLTMPPYILTRRAVKPTKWTKHTRANNTPTGEPSLLSPTGIKIRDRNGTWLSYPEPTPITAMATPTRGITRCEKAEVKTGN